MMNHFEKMVWGGTRPLTLLFCAILIVLSFLFIDKPVAEWMHQFAFASTWPWLSLFTDVGLGNFYIIFLLLFAMSCRFILGHRVLARRVFFLWLCVAMPSLICLTLKILLGRARPELWFSLNLYGFYGPHFSARFWSFPSGHATTIAGLMFGLCALLPRYYVGFLLFGLLIVISRVMLLQHYVSDVFVASVLALIEVGLLDRWLTFHKGDAA